jgi:F-type H+-transporting ATPase subunit epsilon
MALECRIWGGAVPIFSGKANSIYVPGCDGQIGILPGHISLTTTLIGGFVGIFYEEKTVRVEISGGVLLVEDDRVTLWTSYASILDTISESLVDWMPAY